MAAEQTFQVNESGHQKNGKAQRGQWVRAATLGSFFGLVFTTSLVLSSLGIRTRDFVNMFFYRLGLVIAGTLIMAIGEYISVLTQSDMEKNGLYNRNNPSINLAGQAIPGSASGISRPANSFQVLNNNVSVLLPPNPYKAAGASALGVMGGSVVPLVMSMFFIGTNGITLSIIVTVTIVLLVGLGGLGARLSGLPVGKSMARVVIGGMFAIAVASVFLRWFL